MASRYLFTKCYVIGVNGANFAGCNSIFYSSDLGSWLLEVFIELSCDIRSLLCFKVVYLAMFRAASTFGIDETFI
jgi:hypothetical protein